MVLLSRFSSIGRLLARQSCLSLQPVDLASLLPMNALNQLQFPHEVNHPCCSMSLCCPSSPCTPPTNNRSASIHPLSPFKSLSVFHQQFIQASSGQPTLQPHCLHAPNLPCLTPPSSSQPSLNPSSLQLSPCFFTNVCVHSLPSTCNTHFPCFANSSNNLLNRPNPVPWPDLLPERPCYSLHSLPFPKTNDALFF